MKQIIRAPWKRAPYDFAEHITIFAVILVQLFLVLLSQTRVIVNSDGVFSYTLANNPYHYLFIDRVYDEFPNNNGWIDSHILRENYVVEEYDRFNYSAVYYHQRHDVHPPLYYFLVHTFSSLFVGTYSNLYTMTINLIALFLADIIMIKMFSMYYSKAGFVIIPFIFLILMDTMKFLYTWARMYMLLFLFCTWYIYIHGRLISEGVWKKKYLIQMICCIFLGTLTHYYFYVYAALLSLTSISYFIRKRSRYIIANYIYSGIIGLALSWIFYPWALWHIFGNAQNKHTDIAPWTLEKIKQYFVFINDKLFNGRIWLAGLVLTVLGVWVFVSKKKETEIVDANQRNFRRIIFGSGMLYSLIIYTLDHGSALTYYSTPLYTAFIIWFSMVLIDLVKKVKIPWKSDSFIIVITAVCIIVMYSTSVLESYVENAGYVINRVLNHESLKSGFYKFSEDYKQYDCIYIEERQNGVLHNYLFEFGEYGEFKRIFMEEIEQNGLSMETLDGRTDSERGIIVYAPKECVFDESSYKLLAVNGRYNIYELIINGED